MNYNPIKTAKKAAPPLILILIVKAAMAAAAGSGLTLDADTIWAIASGGLAAVYAFQNWLKNRKKKDS